MTHNPMNTALHQQWLRTEEIRLIDFSRNVVRTDGLGAWLDENGNPDPQEDGHTYITGRMAYVSFLAAMRGVPGARERAERLLHGIDSTARDQVHGGWRERNDDDETADKTAYSHAFVILASATAALAGDPSASRILADALDVVDRKFWEAEAGLFADSWAGDWSTMRTYRGLNGNMHLVEAMMAATDATGDRQWAERAIRVCKFVLDRAAENDWRIPEHYNDAWLPQPTYNKDRPGDQFKPYGATVGHAFEWARLIVSAAPTSGERERFINGASALYARAVEDGWARNGRDGFVYTTDWSGAPVVSTRLHWVVTEAIGAASTLARVSDDPKYIRDYTRWWGYAELFLIDRKCGSWRHVLSEVNEPTSTIWSGKPDLYHAYQATLVSQLPLATSFGAAILAD